MPNNYAKIAAAIQKADERIGQQKIYQPSDNPLPQFTAYPWQNELITATTDHRQLLAMCANRVGKTYAAGYMMAVWLTGKYPDWWQGRRYDRPVRAWALGHSSETIRDILQPLLLGERSLDDNSFQGGMVPRGCIAKTVSAMVPGLVKDVLVHNDYDSPSPSLLSFKQYSQGQQALMGQSQDIIWIDESPDGSPRGYLIYPQCITRTADRRGLVYLTFTPEFGVTELVNQFMNDRGPGQYLVNATWDDAPHLDTETKAQILAALPPYQREMRSKGIPILGSGMVYPISEDVLKIEPFAIPSYYKRVAAIDFGITHATAVVWSAYDPDTDIIYIYDLIKETGQIPSTIGAMIRSRGAHIPCVAPHDADQTEKGSGKTIARYYEEAGVNMSLRFRNNNSDEGIKVEPGLMELFERMQTGRLKVFSTLTDWFTEFRLYHREDGKIKKIDDDVMDAFRYSACSVTRFGVAGGRMAESLDKYYQEIDF